MLEFLKPFETIAMSAGAAPEFPLDFVAPGSPRLVSVVVCPDGSVAKAPDGDYIPVPFRTYDGPSDHHARRDAAETAARLLVHAAVERDMVVYDSQAEPGRITARLISLLVQTFRRNGGVSTRKITDLYVCEAGTIDLAAVKYLLDAGITARVVDPADWEAVLACYEAADATFPANDQNLVLAVCGQSDAAVRTQRETPSRINPETGLHEYECGLAVLDHRCVMLGSF